MNKVIPQNSDETTASTTIIAPTTPAPTPINLPANINPLEALQSPVEDTEESQLVLAELEQQLNESPSPLFTQFDSFDADRAVRIATSCSSSDHPQHLKAPISRLAPISYEDENNHPMVSSPEEANTSTKEEAAAHYVKLDVVEFESVEYICYESDKSVEITVIREGSQLEPLVLAWKTVDVAATFFSQVQGEIKFEKGQTRSSFQIEVVWVLNEFCVESLVDLSLEFKHRNESSNHSTLGDVNSTRVVILNVDKFPPGVDDLDNENKVVLAFIKHNYKLFKKKAQFGVILRMIPGVCFVVDQVITYYLLKTITLALLQKENENRFAEEHMQNVAMLGCAYLANFLFTYLCDYLFDDLSIGGCLCQSLRSMCVDTVIQLTDVEAEEFDVGRIIKTNDRDVAIAVETSYLACFNLIGNVIKLLFMMAFLCYTTIEEAQNSNTPSINWLIVIPLLLIIFEVLLLAVTFRVASKKNRSALDADEAWSSFLAQVSSMRGKITNFRKGFRVTDEFEALHIRFNDKSADVGRFTLNIRWIANMLPTITVAMLMIIGARRVMKGDLSLAAFVVILSTIQQIGPTLSDLFMNIFNINRGYASIIKIANLLNSDTRRKSLYRYEKLRKPLMESYEEKEKKKAKSNSMNLLKQHLVLDKSENIIFSNVCYAYPNRPSSMVISDVSFSIELGQIVAVGGGPSVGKKCILKLMVDVLKPTNEDGFVHYPSKLRVRYIDSFPLFFGGDAHTLFKARKRGKEALKLALRKSNGTLDYNLKFGAAFEHPDEKAFDKEIFDLLSVLGMSQHLIGDTFEEYAEGEDAKKYTFIGPNADKLSQTDRSLLSIASALLSSVDLLIIQNVLDTFAPKHGCEVMSILRDFVENRGLPKILKTETNRIPFHMRKKKTIVFSTNMKSLKKMADNWLAVLKSDIPAVERDKSKDKEKTKPEKDKETNSGSDTNV